MISKCHIFSYKDYLKTNFKKRLCKLFLCIIIMFNSIFAQSITVSDNDQLNSNQQQSDQFDTGINVRCACEKDAEPRQWKAINLTIQQYNNIFSIIGLPPEQVPIFHR